MKIPNGTIWIHEGPTGTRTAGLFGVSHRKRGTRGSASTFKWHATYEAAKADALARQRRGCRGYVIQDKTPLENRPASAPGER